MILDPKKPKEITEEEQFQCISNRTTADLVGNSFSESNSVVVVTHSLGTRMVFDSLGLLADDALPDKLCSLLKLDQSTCPNNRMTVPQAEKIEILVKDFRKSLKKIFVMTNQVPLLELALLRTPDEFVDTRAEEETRLNAEPAHLGSGFKAFINEASTPIEIVSFTDHDDLLSYDLKCWYEQNVLRINQDVKSEEAKIGCVSETKEEEHKRQEFWRKVENDNKNSTGGYVRLAGVTMDMAKLEIFNLFAHPEPAHTKYFDDKTVFKLIAKGHPGSGRQNSGVDHASR